MKIKPSLTMLLLLIATLVLVLPSLGISLANLGILLILLLCPLMHYFLMRGHGGHWGHGKPENEGKPEIGGEPERGEGTKPDLEVK